MINYGFLNIMKNFNYDHTSQSSILARAALLKGKTFKYIAEKSPFPQDDVNTKNKGNAGNFVEWHWFGIENNARAEPDFDEAEIELKVCPIKTNKSQLAVKERTKICSIDYIKLYSEQWAKSHAKSKLNKILFIFYLYDKDDWWGQKVLNVALWRLSPNEHIIMPEWEKTRNQVREGYAHTLTERGFSVLSPSRSGSGGVDEDGKQKDLVRQPNTTYETYALKRAFSLKRHFVNQYWDDVRRPKQFESVIETLDLFLSQDFEAALLDKLNSYKGRTIGQISRSFQIEVPNGKAAIPTIIKKAIGFKNVKSKIKEFEQLGVLIKVIPVKTGCLTLYESVSFPKIDFKEFVEESWEDSSLSEQLTRILFVPVSRNKNKGIAIQDRILEESFYWSPSADEIAVIKGEWLRYQDEFKSGVTIQKVPANTKKGYKEVTSLPKESDTKIIHMRPHGSDSNDRDIDTYGTSIVKHSFWLNKKFVNNLIKQHHLNKNINW